MNSFERCSLTGSATGRLAGAMPHPGSASTRLRGFARYLSITVLSTTIQQTAPANAATPASRGDAVDVQGYLGGCSGYVNENVCITSAAIQAQKTSLPLHFPAGVYRLNEWSPPCPLRIVGEGEGKTILQRPEHSLSGSIIHSANCGGLQINGLTVDGNKAKNSTSGYSVVMDGNWNSVLRDVEIENSKAPGSALTIRNTVDDYKGTHSLFSKLNVHDNDGNGIYIQRHAWNWAILNSVIRLNGGDGIDIIDYVFPPARKQFYNCEIRDNDVTNNGGNGISLTSGISGGTSLKPSNGPFDTVESCTIAGNRASFNGSYGIIMTGGYQIQIGFNTTEHNGPGNRSDVAGINAALCEKCTVHDNTSGHNDFYGIDVGGAVDTTIRHNTVTDNGNSTIDNGNGINCGACRHVEILNNALSNNGSGGGGPQIHITSYDGGISGFSLAAQNITIRGNVLACGNSKQIGLLVLSDPPHMIIENNRTQGCSPLLGYVLHVTSARLHANREDGWARGTALITSGGAAVYPDAAEDIAVSPGSSNSLTSLEPYFYSTNFRTVYAVVVTEGGSGYSASPTVSFTGGECDTEPAGTVFQDNAGHVVGVNLSNFGSGCKSAPHLSFRDETGTGAKASAYVLTSLPINGRTLNVRFLPGVTVKESPTNLLLLRHETFAVPAHSSYLSRFEGRENRWVEISRAP
jgi:parallel beta-helix repeat protein